MVNNGKYMNMKPVKLKNWLKYIYIYMNIIEYLPEKHPVYHVFSKRYQIDGPHPGPGTRPGTNPPRTVEVPGRTRDLLGYPLV